jgi:hypothetical protein
MPISDDWLFDDANQWIYHVDGVVTYTGGSGAQPAIGQYIRGQTSGAVGKVIARTGTASAGTLTLTNVVGRFAASESVLQLSTLEFDTVTPDNGGFQVGDTLQGASSSATLVVYAIEYNQVVAGAGIAYGEPMTGEPFTAEETLNISAPAARVQADVCEVLLGETGTDNSGAWTSAALDSNALVVPGTANTNNSVIIHYDNGSQLIPADADVSDNVSGATGRVQKVHGVAAAGSLRLVDSDTTGGAWTDNNNLRILNCVYYDTLVAGKVFSVGDHVQGYNAGLTGVSGRVVTVIDDGDNTGKLILADKTAGSFADADELHVEQSDKTWVKYAEVENGQNAYIDAATINVPAALGGVRDEQRESQGGIYPAGSLNIVRSSSQFYGYVQDVVDEQGYLDDFAPLRANVKDQLYTIINGWQIPDLSFRFLEKGGWQDSSKNNIWTGIQSTSTLAYVGDHGFFYNASNPTPQPNLFIEQNGERLDSWWLEGHIDVLIKSKTSTDPRYINPAVTTLGQLIDGGLVYAHAREYGTTYFWVPSVAVGGLSGVAFNTIIDPNNTTGTHEISYTGTGGFTVGEEIIGGTTGAIGIVTAEDTGTDDLDYILKTPGTQFGSAETITGQVSGATCTFSSVANLVAGYGDDIRLLTVGRKLVESVAASGTFVYGESLTQAVSGWTGYFMGFDSSGDMYVEEISGTLDTNQITGDISTETFTPASDADQSTVPYDLGDGSGTENYNALIAPDHTGADPQYIAAVYEYCKYRTSSEVTTLVGGPGTADEGTEGDLFAALASTYTINTQGCPISSFSGGKAALAQGWFIIKEDLHGDDVQNFTVINAAGTQRTPPNLQSLEMTDANLALPGLTGVRVAAYRSTGAGLKTILRNEFKVGTVGTPYNQAGDSIIEVDANVRAKPLPADVPDTGVLRVLDPNDTGTYLSFPYSSVDRTNGRFTLASGTIGDVTDAADLVDDDNVHVVLIEKESSGSSASNVIQYVAAIPIYWVARLKGWLPADGTASFGATGASIATNLQADENVDLP